MFKTKITPLALVIASLSAPASADLIISEYIEGSSNNKAIELYNNSSSPLALDQYSLNLYVNGKTTIQSTLDFLMFDSKCHRVPPRSCDITLWMYQDITSLQYYFITILPYYSVDTLVYYWMALGWTNLHSVVPGGSMTLLLYYYIIVLLYKYITRWH